MTEFRNSRTHFYLLNNGRTINFRHGAVIGPAIQLIEGEKIAALHALAVDEFEPGIHHVSEARRRQVATFWLDHFLREIS